MTRGLDADPTKQAGIRFRPLRHCVFLLINWFHSQSARILAWRLRWTAGLPLLSHSPKCRATKVRVTA